MMLDLNRLLDYFVNKNVRYTEILLRVSFLVSVALLGFLAGKKIKINQKEIATLLIYSISPIVMFLSVMQAPVGKSYISYSIGTFSICSLSALLALFIGEKLWKDKTSNLFAFAAGTGNTGYFGLPLSLSMFDKAGAVIAVFIILGVNLYEFSFGYYITSLGNYSAKESFSKIVRMPTLYALLLAVLLKSNNIIPNEIILDSLSNFKGAYSILGMMIIGITIANFRKIEFDWHFMGISLF